MANSGLRDLSKQCSKMTDEWLRASVLTAKREFEADVRRDTGGDSVLSGAGVRLSVKARLGDGDATIAAVPRGPWRWVTEGTFNRPQGGSSPAKRTWDRAVDRLMPKLGADADRRFRGIG